jgi:hypothetical protein
MLEDFCNSYKIHNNSDNIDNREYIQINERTWGK